MFRLDRIAFCCAGILAGCSSVPEHADYDHAEPPLTQEHVTELPGVFRPVEQGVILPTAPTNVPVAWVSFPDWVDQHQLGTLTRIGTSSNSIYQLDTSNGQLELRSNSRVAKWEGAEVHLGFGSRVVNDIPLVHPLDLEKNILPLLTPTTLPAPGQRVVVIDPGHGGGNGGTKSVLNGANEKEFTLDWALRLRPLLEANQWQVHLTRTNDSEVPLSDRVALAERCRADLFISLHFNSAAPRRDQNGVETFCLTPVGMKSTLTREYEDNPAAEFANNRFDSENLQYAMRLHRALLKECDFADRGVRRARFLGVLRGQNRPAVLLEAGFLSNPNDAAQIANPAFRQRLAEAVARALQ